MICPHCGKEIESKEPANLSQHQNHLWEEWKDRHEAWSRTFTRYIWVVGVIALLPFTNFSWFRNEFYASIYHARSVYLALLLALFFATNLHLAFEYAAYRSLEDILKGDTIQADRTWWSKLKRAFGRGTVSGVATIIYAVAYVAILIWIFLHYPPPPKPIPCV